MLLPAPGPRRTRLGSSRCVRLERWGRAVVTSHRNREQFGGQRLGEHERPLQLDRRAPAIEIRVALSDWGHRTMPSRTAGAQWRPFRSGVASRVE